MSLDFFNSICKENERSDKLFGICDDQKGNKAFTETANQPSWIAKVSNDSQHAISFIAIDNCMNILKPGSNNKESTCDGMLTFEQALYLVELKEQGTGGWLNKAKSQLENTIELMSKNHDLTQFRFKKAFACNKKHPNFTVIDAAEKKAFFKRTNGFRLDAQTEIVINL